MIGRLVGRELFENDPYRAMFADSIILSIKHAHGCELSDICGDESEDEPNQELLFETSPDENFYQERKRVEVYESRCYILSICFEQDCSWLEVGLDAVAETRKCKWHQVDGCVVCGKRPEYWYDGKPVCWEHKKIIDAYDYGRDIEKTYKDIEKEKERRNEKQIDLIKNEKPIKKTMAKRSKTKLDDEEVKWIFTAVDKYTQKDIARLLGISDRYVRKILNEGARALAEV